MSEFEIVNHYTLCSVLCELFHVPLHLQVKDLREKVEEAESFGARKMKAQLSAMESRVSSLEEQLDVATRYKCDENQCSACYCGLVRLIALVNRSNT